LVAPTILRYLISRGQVSGSEGWTYALLDDVLAFPDPVDQLAPRERQEESLHGDDGGAGGDVLDEATVEGSRREVRVVLASESGGGGERLDPGMSAASL